MKKDYSDEIDVVAERKEYALDANHAPIPDHLTKPPFYALSKDATEEEARQTVIRAMVEQLTFPWTPAQEAKLIYTQIVNKRDRVFSPATAYAGMPYTGGGTGLLQAMEYYDFSNGVMYGLDFENINLQFGNTCATSVNWALNAVCHSISGTTTGFLTPAHGYHPIGEIKVSDSYENYSADENSTKKVTEATDEQAHYRAYAMMKPADAFITVYRKDDGKIQAHAMMCYNKPIVAYRDDGSIDPENSFGIIIDQTGTERDFEINGNHYSKRGRIDMHIPFKELREKNYLPMRTADFLHWKGYTVAESKLDRQARSLKELRTATALSNYRVAKLQVSVISESGAVVYQKKNMVVQAYYEENTDRKLEIASLVPSDAELQSLLKEGRTYTLEARSLLSTGEEFLLAKLPLTVADIQK